MASSIAGRSSLSFGVAIPPVDSKFESSSRMSNSALLLKLRVCEHRAVRHYRVSTVVRQCEQCFALDREALRLQYLDRLASHTLVR